MFDVYEVLKRKDTTALEEWLTENDPNTKTNGWPILQLAAKAGHADGVDLLLAAGADVNASVGFGTALSSAKTVTIAKRLIAAGADPGHVDDYGATILHAYVNRPTLVAWLRKNHVDSVQLDAQNDRKETALHQAASAS